MFPLNRSFKWPFREPEKDYPSDYHFREGRKKHFLNMSLQDHPSHYHFHERRKKHSPNMSLPDQTPDFHLREGRDNYFSNMSISGHRYSYRPYSQGDPTGPQYNNVDDLQPYVSHNGMPPPGARNIRSYTLPSKGARDQEPIWIVPPKKEPRLVTMEVKEPDPEPIMILPPPPPVQKVIEYEVPVKQKEPEPILVPMMPPPAKPQYVTVRQVVEEPAGNYPVPALPPPPPQRTGPIVTRLPDEYKRPKYADTLLGVRRTLLWELVLASFVLFAIMLLIAVFVAGFLS